MPEGKPELSLDEEIYCRGKRKKVTVDSCETNFVDANALEDKNSACYRCPKGREVRVSLADDVNKKDE